MKSLDDSQFCTRFAFPDDNTKRLWIYIGTRKKEIRLNKFKTTDDIWMTIAKAVKMKVDMATMEHMLFTCTNICMYYAWGVCIEPTCKFHHGRDYKGILRTAYKTIS